MLQIDSRAKALIFDVDGTLLDTMDIHYAAWVTVAKRHGFEYPRSLFDEFAGIPTRKIVPLVNERLGYSLDPEQIVSEKEAAFLENIHQVKLIEPVARLVYEGAERKMPMSLGTGGYRYIQDRVLAQSGMDQYFSIVVAAEDVTKHKPHPETFLRCAELMGVAPEDCQVFEDGEQGIAAGLAAGMIVTDVRPFL